MRLGLWHPEPWDFYGETLDSVHGKSRAQQRPVLEYASPAWDSSSSEGIVKLEKVQKAARFVYGGYYEKNPGLCNWNGL